MLVLINAESIQNSGSKYYDEIKKKDKDVYFIATVTHENFYQQVERINAFKNVVGYLYIGDVAFLAQQAEWKTEKPVLLWYDLKTVPLTDEDIKNNLFTTASSVDKRFRLVADLPETFQDMRFIHEFSQKFRNVYFEGGYFLHIDGANLGALTVDDLPFRVPTFSANKIVTKGIAAPYALLDASTVGEIKWSAGKIVVPKTPRVKKDKTGLPKATTKPKADKKPSVKKPSKIERNQAFIKNIFG